MREDQLTLLMDLGYHAEEALPFCDGVSSIEAIVEAMSLAQGVKSFSGSVATNAAFSTSSTTFTNTVTIDDAYHQSDGAFQYVVAGGGTSSGEYLVAQGQQAAAARRGRHRSWPGQGLMRRSSPSVTL